MTFREIQQYLGRTVSITTKCVVLILFLRFFIIDPSVVNGQSMEPTYHDNDHFLINKAIYLFRPPQRYDVVQLYHKETDQYFIKRIIGLPGETVMIRHDGVYVQTVEGAVVKLNESYLSADTYTSVQVNQPVTVHISKNFYYVMGDNRMNSADSRSFGPIHRRFIQGQVIRF